MPALGAPELIIILVIIILIFGVGKLPEVGQALGKGIREFRGAAEDGDEKPDDTPKAAPVVEAPRPVAAVQAPQTVVSPVVVGPAPAHVAAPTVSAAAPHIATSSPTVTIAYTVQAGDTIDSIAQRHGVETDAVMAANGYSQRDRVLYEGDRIQVPTATTRA